MIIVTNLSSAFPVAFIWRVALVQAFAKPRISALSRWMVTNTGSLLALSLTSALPLVPSSEPIHRPREKVTYRHSSG